MVFNIIIIRHTLWRTDIIARALIDCLNDFQHKLG